MAEFKAKHELCSRIGYLIGVSANNFYEAQGSTLSAAVFREMDAIREAQTLRDLCILRSAMLKNNSEIYRRFRDGRNIRTLGTLTIPTAGGSLEIEPVPVAVLDRLYRNGISIYLSRPDIYQYLMLLNQKLSQCLDTPAARRLFPPDLQYAYLREMFLFPQGTTAKNVLFQAEGYLCNRRRYPYGCYINWPPQEGNLLAADDTFVQQLYEQHQDSYENIRRYRSYPAADGGDIRRFLEQQAGSIIVVDCATVRAELLYAVWDSLTDRQRGSVQSVLLLCPGRAAEAWRLAAQRIPCARVQPIDGVQPGDESWSILLADMVSQELFRPETCGVLLMTEDTAYMTLLEESDALEMPFLVVTGRENAAMRQLLAAHGMQPCFPEMLLYAVQVDAGEKKTLAQRQLNACFPLETGLNLRRLAEQALGEAPFSLAEDEQAAFYSGCLARLRLEVAPDGAITLQLK